MNTHFKLGGQELLCTYAVCVAGIEVRISWFAQLAVMLQHAVMSLRQLKMLPYALLLLHAALLTARSAHSEEAAVPASASTTRATAG
jgi:hypothetical protein